MFIDFFSGPGDWPRPLPRTKKKRQLPVSLELSDPFLASGKKRQNDQVQSFNIQYSIFIISNEISCFKYGSKQWTYF